MWFLYIYPPLLIYDAGKHILYVPGTALLLHTNKAKVTAAIRPTRINSRTLITVPILIPMYKWIRTCCTRRTVEASYIV